jgi:undecaprenyl-diphosphatase
MTSVFHAIVLGIVQGITEFLPISSTGHLVLIPRLLHWPEQGLTFDVALHVGTLIALLVYFRRDWADIIMAAFGHPQTKTGESRGPRWLLWGIIIATIPAAVAGKLWDKKFETMLDTETSKMMFIVAGAMVVFALVIYAADKIGRKRRSLGQMNFVDWILIGLAQAVALIPGVSRSGATISAGLFRNLDRDSAARFSFLLSTPIILGAAALKLKDVMKTGLPADERTPFVAGILTSAVVGYIVIAFLLSYLRRHNLNVVVWYRLAFGVILLALLAAHVI